MMTFSVFELPFGPGAFLRFAHFLSRLFGKMTALVPGDKPFLELRKRGGVRSFGRSFHFGVVFSEIKTRTRAKSSMSIGISGKGFATDFTGMRDSVFICRRFSEIGDAGIYKSFLMPILYMLSRTRKQFKILDSIIRRIVIDMMHDFFSVKESAERFFHHKTMLGNIPLFPRIGMVTTKHIPITVPFDSSDIGRHNGFIITQVLSNDKTASIYETVTDPAMFGSWTQMTKAQFYRPPYPRMMQ